MRLFGHAYVYGPAWVGMSTSSSEIESNVDHRALEIARLREALRYEQARSEQLASEKLELAREAARLREELEAATAGRRAISLGGVPA